jgi:hypothetical protein
MSTPRTGRAGVDPEADRQRAVKHAHRLAEKAQQAEHARDVAIAFAAEQGASLRELGEAVGLSHEQVRRVVERVRLKK